MHSCSKRKGISVLNFNRESSNTGQPIGNAGNTFINEGLSCRNHKMPWTMAAMLQNLPNKRRSGKVVLSPSKNFLTRQRVNELINQNQEQEIGSHKWRLIW